MKIVILTLSAFCLSEVFLLPIGPNQTSYDQEVEISTHSTKDDITLLKQQMSMVIQRENEMEKNLTGLILKTIDDKMSTYRDQSDNVGQEYRTLNTDVVGFTALLKDNAVDLPTGSTEVYDTVLYNAGNGYDKTTGIFTCPRSGLYLFYVNVEPVYRTPASAISIYINGSPRVDAVAERYDTGHDSTGGNMMVEHIQAGDRVWAETYSLDNQDLYEGFTSFSGVLINST